MKRDGTACMVKDGALFKRYDAKRNKKGEFKAPPAGAIPCDEPDTTTGHWPHWVQVSADDPSDRHHVAAWLRLEAPLADGTYELCGPHFQGNPEGFAEDTFVRHGAEQRMIPRFAAPLFFGWLRAYLTVHEIEGLVFAHGDGRFAKIRRADFGLAWPVRRS